VILLSYHSKNTPRILYAAILYYVMMHLLYIVLHCIVSYHILYYGALCSYLMVPCGLI